jgi:hypothetical protein
MSPEERVSAVAEFGFTERQARFLVTVLLYSGVCVPRQYATFAGIAYGHKASRFFDVLANYGFAVVSDCLHNRARVYHLADARLYEAIGLPHSRYRRPVVARQVRDRLLRLGACPPTFDGGVAHCPRWTTDSAPAACAVDLGNEMGRRLVPPPTAVPIATAEEP